VKSVNVNFRLKPDELQKLHKYASKYNMSGTLFLKRMALAFIGDKTRQEESEKLLRDMAKAFAQQTEDLEFYTNIIADSTNRISSSISQIPIELRTKRRKIKKRI